MAHDLARLGFTCKWRVYVDMNKSHLVMLTMAVYLGGCSTASPIQKVSESKSNFDSAVFGGETNVVDEDTSGSERYRIFHQAATGFVSVMSIRNSAEQRANQFCDKKKKVMKTLEERTSQPPHILGNFPRIEIVFVCVDKPDLAIPIEYEDTLYIKLSNLKKLLDGEAITQEEYNREKVKLLKQP